MIGLDTNVLVRYLTRDDEIQYQLAFDLITGNETFFITNKEIKPFNLHFDATNLAKSHSPAPALHPEDNAPHLRGE
jgi:hypothetical protein